MENRQVHKDKTLLEIYHILMDSVLEFTNDSTQTRKQNEHMRHTMQETARKLKVNSCPVSTIRQYKRRSSTGTLTRPSKEETKEEATIKVMEKHELNEFREKIKVEKTLQKINCKLQRLEKEVHKKLDPENTTGGDILNLLLEMRSSLDESLTVQHHTDGLVERICAGVQQLLDNKPDKRRGVHGTFKIPAELRMICDRMQSKDVDFKTFGEALGIEEDVLHRIDLHHNEDSCEDEKYKDVLQEWTGKTGSANIRELLAACSTLGGSIPVYKGKLLGKEETDKLLKNVDYLCENMLDVPLLLPHLISTLVMSPQLSEYVLAPSGRIERIVRLVDVLCTKENGYREFCIALRRTKQEFLAEYLEGGREPRKPKRSASCSQLLDDDNDDVQSNLSEDITAPPDDVLNKIVTVLRKAGVISKDDLTS